MPDYRNDVKLLMCNRRKPQKNIDDLINNYNSTLQKLTDKYAALKCKTISLRPHAPGYTSPIRQEKGVRRRSERVAARTMLEVDRQIVQDMYRRRNEQLVEAKTSYFTKHVVKTTTAIVTFCFWSELHIYICNCSCCFYNMFTL